MLGKALVHILSLTLLLIAINRHLDNLSLGFKCIEEKPLTLLETVCSTFTFCIRKISPRS